MEDWGVVAIMSIVLETDTPAFHVGQVSIPDLGIQSVLGR